MADDPTQPVYTGIDQSRQAQAAANARAGQIIHHNRRPENRRHALNMALEWARLIPQPNPDLVLDAAKAFEGYLNEVDATNG